MTGLEIGVLLFVVGPLYSAHNLWKRLNGEKVENPGGAAGEVAYLAVFAGLPAYAALKLARRIP